VKLIVAKCVLFECSKEIERRKRRRRSGRLRATGETTRIFFCCFFIRYLQNWAF